MHHILLLISGSLHRPILKTPCMHGSAIYYMRFRTRAANDPSLRWIIQDLDLWLECFPGTSSQANHWPCNHCGGTMHYFAPLLHMMLEDYNQLLLITSNKPTRYAKISTGLTVTETTENFHTDARSVPGPILPGATWQRGSPIPVKSPPWTLLRPFMLKHELCNYPDRVFVRQLIDNL